MSGKLWSEAEYATLRDLYARQMPLIDMVQYLPGRSVNGIWQAAVRAKLVKAKEPSPLLPQKGENEAYSAAAIARSSARFVADGLKLMAARA
jgi:hypothetical protein